MTPEGDFPSQMRQLRAIISALTLWLGDRKGIRLFILKGSFQEAVEDKTKGNQLTQHQLGTPVEMTVV